MAQAKNINNAILGVLESIDAKLDKQEQSTQNLNTNLQGMASTGVVSEKEYESFAKFFGVMAKGISGLVKAMDNVSPKTGEKFGTFIGKIGETIEEFYKKTDQKQVTAFTALLQVLKTGVLMFAIQMVLAIPFLILAPIGAVLFGWTIRALMWAMGAAGSKGAKKKQMEGIKAIMGLARSILLFALSMILYILVAPLVMIGVVLFGLTIRLLMWTIGLSGKNAKKNAKGLAGILKLAKGILLFALAIIVFLLVSPLVLVGVIVFSLVVWILSLGMRTMGSKKVKKGVRGLMTVVLSMLLLALTVIIVAAFVTWQDLALVGAMIGGLALIVVIVGFFSKKIRKGAMALLIASFAVAVVAIAMVIFKSAAIEWKDIAILGAVIGGMALIATVLGIPPISNWAQSGAIALIIMSAALTIFSIALLIYAQAAPKLTWSSIGMLAAVIGVMALIGTILGIPPIVGFAIAGSAALIIAAGALVIFSVALLIYTKAKMTWKDVGILGATILMVGLEFAAFGLASPLIFVGGGAMIVAAAALLPITASLAIFKASGWKRKDNSNLESALAAVQNGFLGGRIPGGIIAALKFAAKALARAAMVAAASALMIPAGIALMLITPALSIFKKSKFGKKDADNMEFAIGGIVKAFGLITDTERQKKMGFYVTPWQLWLGIAALARAGTTLANLAKGVQAWANLTIKEYEVINPGTKDAKIVPSGKRQLSKSDFKKAAFGMATVISAIAKPFADVGKLEMGAPSGNPILDSIFGGKRYVSRGIKALSKSGDTLVSLAKGVQAWAKLEVTEYEVVDAGTADAKIVPKSVRKLTPGDLFKAKWGMSMVIKSLSQTFADVGRLEHGESSENTWLSSIFGGKKWVSKGVQAMAGVGDNIVALGTGIQNWANMSITEYEVVGAGTKDAKLVPKGQITMTPTMMTDAAKNAGSVITLFAEVFADVGRMNDGRSANLGFWGSLFSKSRDYVKKGVESMSGIGNIVTGLAEGVLKMADMQVVETEVVNAGTSRAKVVPKRVRKVSPAEQERAAKNLGSIIMTFASVFAKVGSGLGIPGFKYVTKEDLARGVDMVSKMSKPIASMADTILKMGKMEVVVNEVKRGKIVPKAVVKLRPSDMESAAKNVETFTMFMASMVASVGTKLEPQRGALETGSEIIKKLVGSANEIAKPIDRWSKIKKMDTVMKNMDRFMGFLMKYFDPEKNKQVAYANKYLWKFSWSTHRVAKSAPGFKEFVGHQKELTATINNLDMDRLKILDSLMCSLATLGNTNVGLDRLGEEIGDGMKEGFELLAEMLAELIAEQQSQSGGLIEAITGSGGEGGDAKAGEPGKPKGAAPAGLAGDIAKAVKSALSGLPGQIASKTLTVKSSKGIGNPVAF